MDDPLGRASAGEASPKQVKVEKLPSAPDFQLNLRSCLLATMQMEPMSFLLLPCLYGGLEGVIEPCLCHGPDRGCEGKATTC